MTFQAGGVATRVCPACHVNVPAGVFCGKCGAEMDRASPLRRILLRPRVFAAAPNEPIALPLITSSLFPHLGRRSRNPFRLGLLLLALGLLAGSVLQWPGPLVTIAGLGLPLLFGLYLWESGVLRDMPGHVLAIAMFSGIGLGVLWILLTGGIVARAYGIPLVAGFVLEQLIGVGLFISVGGALLMVLPVIIVRMLRPPVRESLDGFVIGALGALSFTGAATITRLAPQFTAGMIDNVQPSRLFIEAALYGAAIPLTAAAAGGLIGVMLWFRPGRRAGGYPRRIRVALVVFTGTVVALYAMVWVVDSARLPKISQLALHLVLTVLALLALRFGMQMALLHEEPDPFTGQPVLCEHCERVVPDMPLCPACGAATRAASRTARRWRRELQPVHEVSGGAEGE